MRIAIFFDSNLHAFSSRLQPLSPRFTPSNQATIMLRCLRETPIGHCHRNPPESRQEKALHPSPPPVVFAASSTTTAIRPQAVARVTIEEELLLSEPSQTTTNDAATSRSTRPAAPLRRLCHSHARVTEFEEARSQTPIGSHAVGSGHGWISSMAAIIILTAGLRDRHRKRWRRL